MKFSTRQPTGDRVYSPHPAIRTRSSNPKLGDLGSSPSSQAGHDLTLPAWVVSFFFFFWKMRTVLRKWWVWVAGWEPPGQVAEDTDLVTGIMRGLCPEAGMPRCGLH